MTFIKYSPDPICLDQQGAIPDQVHLFEEREVKAINAALAAGRPLLVRGEPGTGKSQLARAAAKVLGRVYIQHVVDSRDRVARPVVASGLIAASWRSTVGWRFAKCRSR